MEIKQENKLFDVIIVGASYSGLSAAMALGRALKTVLLIDDGKPCNRQTPQSHNFLTNDGRPPAEIAAHALSQVQAYQTVRFFKGTAVTGSRIEKVFQIEAASGETFKSKKLVFATGIKDILPSIPGFAECWGISVIHCPYCHGYEVRKEPTGILSNGEMTFDYVRMIHNWTKQITLFSNGPLKMSLAEVDHLRRREIKIVENEIDRIEHLDGHMRELVFKDGSSTSLSALYATVRFEQHSDIPVTLGCELTDQGYIKVNEEYQATVNGIYAAGDNCSRMRTVANAVAAGNAVGMIMSKKMILEEF